MAGDLRAALDHGELFTTDSWYYRLSHAVHRSEVVGKLSGAFASLDDDARTTALRGLNELPAEVGLLSLRKLVPIMSLLDVGQPLNLLSAEALAACVVLSDPAMMSRGPETQLRLVAEAANLTIGVPPIPLPSDSNDAWKIGDLVLRICWRGDRTRLQREALLLEHLPAEVPHVRLAGAGVNDDLTWTLTHWVPGTMLSAQCSGRCHQGQSSERMSGSTVARLRWAAWTPPASM